MKTSKRPKQRIPFLMVLLLSLSLLACGTGQNGEGIGSDDLLGNNGGGGGAGLGPNPEDIFDFPNILPDDFLAVACPPSWIEKEHDLATFLTSPDPDLFPKTGAPLADLDDDGFDDAIVLFQGDPSPKTWSVEVHNINGQALPPDFVDFGGFSRFHMGLERDVNGDLQSPIPQGGVNPPLVEGYWQGDFTSPILNMDFIPGSLGDDANPGYFFPLELTGTPGVYVVAAKLVDNDGVLHCSEYVFRMLICPEDGSVTGYEDICLAE